MYHGSPVLKPNIYYVIKCFIKMGNNKILCKVEHVMKKKVTANILSNVHVLCVSCPSAIEFSAISLEGFRQTMAPNFIQIRQRIKIFPHRPPL